MKRIFSLVLCALILIPCLASCSKPPEYSEIEERFRELVEASGEINMIFFGEGLPTYERITDPQSTMDVYVEETTDENGETKKTYHYYYKVPDGNYDSLYAYRKSYLDDYVYISVQSTPDAEKTPFYEDESRSVYAYLVEGYTEPEYEFFYDSEDPHDYDYVRPNEKYRDVDDIKAAAEKVYSSDYLEAIYESMFIGSVAASDKVEGLSARYIEYSDSEGNISLMRSNTSAAFITEIRQYDFSTAKIVKPANSKYVTIEIDSYLPSKPAERLTVRLSMLLENGQWMLDAATY